MKKLILTLSIIAVWYNGYSQSKLTFEEAVATALENNYGIKIARNTKAIADNNSTLGNAGFLPTLDINASINKAIVNGEQITSTETRPIENSVNQSEAIGATLNWTIFDGLAMFHNRNILEQLNTQSENDLQLQVQTTIFNVGISFYRTALEAERLNSLMSTLDLSEQRQNIAKDKYELGKGSKLEYLQAQVDYNTDKSNVANQEIALKTQKYNLLRQMVTGDDSLSFEVVSQLQIDKDININDVLNSMRMASPEVRSLEQTMKIARLNESLIKAERLPTVSLFSGYNLSEVTRAVGFTFTSNTNELSYGATANVRVFNGFNTTRRIQNSRIEAQNAELVLKQRILEMETMINQAYLNYANNLTLIELESENVKIAEENYEIAQERYRIGLSSPVELRESQVNLVNAELRLQNAAFAAKLAEIELKYLSGQLLQKN